MKILREILDWIPLILLIAGGIAFSIYLQNWILLGLIMLGIVLFGGFIYLMGMGGLESGFAYRKCHTFGRGACVQRCVRH